MFCYHRIPARGLVTGFIIWETSGCAGERGALSRKNVPNCYKGASVESSFLIPEEKVAGHETEVISGKYIKTVQ